MKTAFAFLILLACTPSFGQVNATGDAITLADIDRLISRYQYQDALAALNNVDSTSVEVLRRSGNCYFHMGDYGDAIRQFEKILEIDSMNIHGLFQLGQLYSRTMQYKEAYGCYQKLIARDSTNGVYYKQYAVVASQANDPLVALSNFYKAVSLNAHDVEAYFLFGNMLLDMEQYPVADSILTAALTINQSTQLKLLLAKAQMGEEKYEEALATTTQLLMKGDTLPAYARIMGISYFQLDEYDKVIPWMNILVDNGMTAEWINYYLGVSYQQLNKPDSAIIYLNKAIEEGISENISNYYTQLAVSYEDKKDYKSAIKYYKAAYESSRKDILLYHLGRNYDVYYRDKKQAITYFKRYLNSEDTIKVAKEYTRRRLRQLGDYR